MSIAALEGFVEKGQIRLKADVRLPDHTKVYVIVPDLEVRPVFHIFSPRLAHPEQAADFEVIEVTPDAGISVRA